jgi:hypothetical protein
MTDSTNVPENDLQFDQADFNNPDAKEMECGACRKKITKTYFDINGKSVCPECRHNFEAAQSKGNGTTRFLRAILFGVPAAILGAGIYYGISAATGYEFGLVAIVIGLMVGAAVRAGCRRRGGWAYQTLAILLTYMSIVSTYIPYMIQGISEADKNKTSESSQPVDQTVKPDAENTPASMEASQEAQSKQHQAAQKVTVEKASILMAIIPLVLLFAYAMVAPFLMGFENILGLIIIAIGLYEAWKLNKRMPINISGPFTITPDNTETITVNE